MLEVRYAPEVEDDLVNVAQWYVKKSPELGGRFLDDFAEASTVVALAGATCRCVLSDYRRILLNNFPYAIYFTAIDNLATIYLVIHTSRNPALVRQMLTHRR